MTSNKTTKRIESYLDNKMSNLERWRFEVDLLIDPELFNRYKEHLLILKLVKHYHHIQLKNSFDKIYTELLNDINHPEFRNKINSIF